MLDIPRHRKILFDILRDLYSGQCASSLGFKGGTMLYFFYGLDRFSVDLDFDLLPSGDVVLVSSAVRRVLSKYGSIEDEMNKNFTWFFLLRYASGQQGVKVEISKREQPLNRYETKNFYGRDVVTLSLEDSFAHKLVAVTQRKNVANRDFFDVWFLLQKGVVFNDAIVAERTGKTGVEYLEVVREYAEKNIRSNSILDGIGELVSEKQKQWLKRDFKKELLVQLDFFIDQLRRK